MVSSQVAVFENGFRFHLKLSKLKSHVTEGNIGKFGAWLATKLLRLVIVFEFGNNYLRIIMRFHAILDTLRIIRWKYCAKKVMGTHLNTLAYNGSH